MRRLPFVSFIALVAGCGVGSMSTDSLGGWKPIPPTADQIQILGPLMKDIQPGENVTYCSYLDLQFDQDIDIVAYVGSQSPTGHHAILYAARAPKPVDTHVCTDQDMNNGRFLAATGSDTAAPAETIPAGVAFRVTKGTQVYLQTHWINATTTAVDGQGAINITYKPADPNRVVAAEFVTLKTGLNIPPGISTESQDCVMGESLQLYMLGGHAHEHATNVTVDYIANSQTTNLYNKSWSPEFTFNTPFVNYGLTKPLDLNKGDSIRVSCTWNNKSANPIMFPDEMCVAYGFYFPVKNGDIYCIDGNYPTM